MISESTLTPQPSPSPLKRFWHHWGWETLGVLVIIGIFLAFNVITFWISPVMFDETLLTDPAINVNIGKGFTSTIFPFQPRQEFWVGNASLHPMTLVAWIKAFGFSMFSVRLLNYLEISLAIFFIWLGTLRLNIVTHSANRLAMVFTLFSLDGIFYNYRAIRYDCLNILLIAACFLVYSIPPIWLRCVLLTCISMFLPMAGINLGAYVPLMCGLLLVYLRKDFLKETISILIGCLVGLFYLYLFYSTNGVWKMFLLASFGVGATITGKIGQAVIQGDTSQIASYLQLIKFPMYYPDSSSPLLLGILAGMVIYQIAHHQFKKRSILSFGLASGLVLPMGMFIAGQYPIYYTWMGLIPMTICLFGTLDFSQFQRRKFWHWLLLVFVILTPLVGLPLRFGKIAAIAEELNYEPIEKLVQQSLRKEDWALVNFSTFYAVKQAQKEGQVAEVFFPSYAEGKSRFSEFPEREKISVMMIPPNILEKMTKRIGGEWVETGQGITPNFEPYHLQVYRRKS